MRGERSREQGTRGNPETVCANPLQASVSGGTQHTGEPVQLPHFMEETQPQKRGPAPHRAQGCTQTRRQLTCSSQGILVPPATAHSRYSATITRTDGLDHNKHT